MPTRSAPQFPTSFAELLFNYMWEQRPPLKRTEFAEILGIGRTTLTNWLSGARPEMALLFVVNERTGIPLNRLMDAAGYPTPPDPDAAFAYILDDLRHDAELGEAEREFLIARITALRDRYTQEQKANASNGPTEASGAEDTRSAGPSALTESRY